MILETVAQVMEKSGLNYQFNGWEGAVVYPYFVGSYTETGHAMENGCTTAAVTLDGWSRTGAAELLAAKDVILGAFEGLTVCRDNVTVCFSYENGNFIPSGEDGLYRVSIVLAAREWKG